MFEAFRVLGMFRDNQAKFIGLFNVQEKRLKNAITKDD